MSVAVLSPSFAPALERLRNPSSDAIVEALGVNGCVIVTGALPRRQVETLSDDLTPWFEDARCGEGHFFGRKTKRFSGLFAKSRSTAALAIEPTILDAVERTLAGPNETPACDCIQLNLTQAIEIGPGEGAQLLHRDDNLFPMPKSFELMVNVMWPLDDFTAQNGATRLTPGSHRWPRENDLPDMDAAVSAEASVGDAIIWLGSLLHGGGANRSGEERRGIVMSYSLGWLAPAEKLLLSIPPPIAATLPRRLQRLLGYQLHRPNLGWVEGRDPVEWLDGDTGPLAAAADNLTPIQEHMLEDYFTTVGTP